eukprot:CAMPEP_0184299168 /NCGR_PEP_ID=MMETSP1049-20130417/9832_1 /TAXON_ID=77928 /ORGANISM="Proteomonas sulcata, Strain CCMP704" /LENGTH=74 /DNA_ID=CAMNT_0026609525 /DNA_START=401 /DNA_END=625 /DNA_ORIENTATION=+
MHASLDGQWVADWAKFLVCFVEGFRDWDLHARRYLFAGSFEEGLAMLQEEQLGATEEEMYQLLSPQAPKLTPSL